MKGRKEGRGGERGGKERVLWGDEGGRKQNEQRGGEGKEEMKYLLGKSATDFLLRGKHV